MNELNLVGNPELILTTGLHDLCKQITLTTGVIRTPFIRRESIKTLSYQGQA